MYSHFLFTYQCTGIVKRILKPITIRDEKVNGASEYKH